MKTKSHAVATLIAFAVSGFAFGGAETGNWKRKGTDVVAVSVKDGGLYCKITSGSKVGFEMCHGMKNVGGDVWKGKTMKHPSMPSFMTFNGTVTITGDKLEIKGCAIGNGMCDKEVWTRIQ